MVTTSSIDFRIAWFQGKSIAPLLIALASVFDLGSSCVLSSPYVRVAA
jgi:hypothetical protein